MLSTEENTKKLEMIIRTFFNRLEGYHVQYNVVDKATLLDAQAHPERYQQLVVRIWGWSAYFVELDRDFQNHVMARQEYSV